MARAERNAPVWMKRTMFALIGLLACVVALYLFWMTTPFYAFQEAAVAVHTHDLAKFNDRVDLRGFIDSLLNDLLIYPAKTTPGLSPLQEEVANDAVKYQAHKLSEQLVTAIEHGISRAPRVPRVSIWGEQPAQADELIASNDLNDLLKVTAKEVGGSVSRMKEVCMSRMQQYAQAHRDTTPGRLLACSASDRVFELKEMLNEDGLTLQNFKGVSSYETSSNDAGDTCKIGFRFFSPKANHEATLLVELCRTGLFSDWRIMRICDASNYFAQLGENYDSEIQQMVLASLSGINQKSVGGEVQDMADRIKQSKPAQSIFKRLNLHF
ncbi:MAG TPA: hypothetical protein V6C81_20990 [Planktothrix sp.]|jgi:hypothetical protein